ncbi:DUF7146 domain-containing protein [Sphingomonas koreensis]
MTPTVRNLELETAAAEITAALGGTWRPEGAMCRCPAHEDHTPSLSVRVGRQSLLFKCFAGCSAIDVIRAIRGLKREVPVTRAHGPEMEWRNSAMAERARAIWNEASPIADTPGAHYLAGRAIKRPVPVLRFHPRTPLGRGRAVRFRPAIIAPVCRGSAVLAIQRIFLAAGAPVLAPDLSRPKLTLGRPLDGAVMLHPAGPVLGLAEGVETAISAAILLGIPVWATLGNERLACISLPKIVRRVILLPDADAPGRLGARRAHAAYEKSDRTVETLWPWHGLNDWNDVLRAEGERGGIRVRQAA